MAGTSTAAFFPLIERAITPPPALPLLLLILLPLIVVILVVGPVTVLYQERECVFL